MTGFTASDGTWLAYHVEDFTDPLREGPAAGVAAAISPPAAQRGTIGGWRRAGGKPGRARGWTRAARAMGRR
jgi:hypothetical protein